MRKSTLINISLIILIISLLYIVGPGIKYSKGYSDKHCTHKDYKLEIQKVNGEWIEANYNLPEDSEFFIHTSRGSYTLCIKTTCVDYYGWENREVRAGIIDFKIKNY